MQCKDFMWFLTVIKFDLHQIRVILSIKKKKKKKERKKEAIHVTFRVQLSGCTLHDQCHSNTNEQVVLNTHFYHANVLKIFLNSNWQSPKLRFLLQPMKSLTQIIQTT